MEVEATPPSVSFFCLSEHHRKLIIDNNDTFEFSSVSCHSRAMQGCVKLLSVGSNCIIQKKPCVGFTRVRINSHEIMFHFRYKRPTRVNFL